MGVRAAQAQQNRADDETGASCAEERPATEAQSSVVGRGRREGRRRRHRELHGFRGGLWRSVDDQLEGLEFAALDSHRRVRTSVAPARQNHVSAERENEQAPWRKLYPHLIDDEDGIVGIVGRRESPDEDLGTAEQRLALDALFRRQRPHLGRQGGAHRDHRRDVVGYLEGRHRETAERTSVRVRQVRCSEEPVRLVPPPLGGLFDGLCNELLVSGRDFLGLRLRVARAEEDCENRTREQKPQRSERALRPRSGTGRSGRRERRWGGVDHGGRLYQMRRKPARAERTGGTAGASPGRHVKCYATREPVSDPHPVDFDAIPGELPHVGSLIDGKYVIEAILGRGAMGTVYRAVHQFTGRRVALKWMLADSAEARRRFIREARNMGAIEHPQVVSVFDFGAHDGSVFLVMEYLEGTNLRAHVAKRIVPVAETIRLIMPALEGVAAAHLAGIVHRDIKPENLFVCIDRDGTVYDTRVLDLGIARSLRPKNNMDDKLTRSGVAIGTPRYMAPEQLRGSSSVDHRVDIFALGLVIYEMLAGRLPYQSETYESLVIDIVTGTPPSPRLFNAQIPEELAQVVLKALAREATDRFEDVGALATALEPFGDGVRYRAPRSIHVRQSEMPGDPSELSGSEPAFDAAVIAPTQKPTVDFRQGRMASTSVSGQAVPAMNASDTDPISRASAPIGRTGELPLRSQATFLLVSALVLAATSVMTYAWLKNRQTASEEAAHRRARAENSTATPPSTLPSLSQGASALRVEPVTTPPPTPNAEPPVAAPPPATEAPRATSSRRVSNTTIAPAMTETPAPPPPATMTTEVRGRTGVLRPGDF